LKWALSAIFWAFAMLISYEVGRTEDPFSPGMFWFTLASAGFVYVVSAAIWRALATFPKEP
jgi:hypothetical protein